MGRVRRHSLTARFSSSREDARMNEVTQLPCKDEGARERASSAVGGERSGRPAAADRSGSSRWRSRRSAGSLVVYKRRRSRTGPVQSAVRCDAELVITERLWARFSNTTRVSKDSVSRFVRIVSLCSNRFPVFSSRPLPSAALGTCCCHALLTQTSCLAALVIVFT